MNSQALPALNRNTMTRGVGSLADPTLVLTVSETAEALKLGRTKTYEAIREGRIPHILIGRRILVPKAALMRMLDGVC